jgi:medium-chain acyl-[acyl-carrier-protein] hydrolase
MIQDLDRQYTPFRPNPAARVRLFCFPYAGGGVAIFYRWAAVLPPEIHVCPVALPGRESRIQETPVTRIAPLVDTLTHALAPYLDLPCAFFGHSMGALIAFELARSLGARGSGAPSRLFVAAYRAPQLARRQPPIHHLGREALFRELQRRYDGIPSAILQDDTLSVLFARVLQADMEIIETYAYVPGEPLRCPLSAFGGLEDAEVPREDLGLWREQTSGSFKLRMLPGGHFFLGDAREPLLGAIVEDLSSLLALR